jgi:hypothetical protein
MASGGVAVLYSVKPSATLAEVENSLTTDIAALGLSGSSAMHLTVNDGSQNITRPALRLTASSYRMLGTTESSGSASSTSGGANTDPVIAQAQICLFSKPGYVGALACATQAYDTGTSNSLFYRFTGKVGSIRIMDVQTNTQLAANKATVTLYTALSASSQSGSVNVSTADTTRLTIFNNPTIRMVRIQTQ